jgi:hypothetical protein
MKQLRSFIGVEQGFVKQVRELAGFPLMIHLLRLAATPGRTTVKTLVPSAGSADS